MDEERSLEKKKPNAPQQRYPPCSGPPRISETSFPRHSSDPSTTTKQEQSETPRSAATRQHKRSLTTRNPKRRSSTTRKAPNYSNFLHRQSIPPTKQSTTSSSHSTIIRSEE